MSKKADGGNLDASTFDVDAWIDAKVRPEVTVKLYPNDDEFAARAKAIEDQILIAEQTKPEDRGLDNPSPEALAARLVELRAEREATALAVRIRQVTRVEHNEAVKDGSDAGLEGLDLALHALAEACVEPAFTPEQLRRLCRRDVSGERMVNQLAEAAANLRDGVPIPFSLAPSGGSPTS
jgi:plasmid stability protein